MDTVHPQHNSVMSNGWIKQGKAFRLVAIGAGKDLISMVLLVWMR